MDGSNARTWRGVLLAWGLVVASAFAAHAQEAPASAPQPSAPALRVDWRDHPTLYVGRSTRIEGRMRIQTDASDGDVVGDDGPGGVDVARRRIGARGVVG
ncbi:MAG: hypothetical protein FJW27_17745 [Acidimicrobiia bacterium]|nr:hypothetical protein [Acidimicrobiia bacterium]